MSIKVQENIIKVGQDVLIEEGRALIYSASLLGDSFSSAVDLILNCNGRIVLSGIGKSGHIAKKIAATLASTGSPSFFLHPAEAGHGDLGMLTKQDILIVITNSGETSEIIDLVTIVNRREIDIISITSKSQSTVGKLSQCCISSEITSEACPLDIAPTTSTTVQLGLGDALAVAVLVKRGFTSENFAMNHPAGSLGKRYYLRVRDVMIRIEDIPQTVTDTPLKMALPKMAMGRAGAILVINDGKLKGIFTDSDLRRVIAETDGGIDKILACPISKFMKSNPYTIADESLASSALEIFEKQRISRLICINDGAVKGLLALHNLLDHKIA